MIFFVIVVIGYFGNIFPRSLVLKPLYIFLLFKIITVFLEARLILTFVLALAFVLVLAFTLALKVDIFRAKFFLQPFNFCFFKKFSEGVSGKFPKDLHPCIYFGFLIIKFHEYFRPYITQFSLQKLVIYLLDIESRFQAWPLASLA